MQLSHSRQPKYSIYTGIDKAARDMTQMQRSSQQIERALERVKIIQRGAGTLALESLLNNYKARHVECLHGTTLPRKYIVVEMWDEYAGLGNQFPSIITGLLMALLTERCLFINFPFYHKTFLSEVDFSWEHHTQRLMSFGHDVTKTPPHPIQFWKGEDLSNWLLKDQKTLYEPHYGIHLKNDPDYTAALLQANPYHAPFLQAVFPTGEMFQPLARFMLRVRPDLEEIVQDFKRKYFRPFTVGLQIRALKCDGGQGSIHCDELPMIENFVAVARSLQRSKGIPDSEFRVFVGADKRESYDKVVEIMGQDMVIYRPDNGVGTVKSKVIGVNNPGTPESALIDMRLLSECNELVVTVGSSYGSIASGIGGIAPVQMIHGKHENVQNPYWYKAITSEPCYWKGNIFLNNKDPFWGKLGPAEVQQFKSNPFWMQYTQCHCAT
ncbi:g5974 [Coccomyxa viridis]|uniref:Fucosyltransferase n=1 Tax=Coccomyxa viridis TaxID=1274662 RepID=A0ABP1FY66_9CHLO